MKNHDGCYRGFVWYSKAYYADSLNNIKLGIIDEITFGMYDPEGGTSGEMSMVWTKLGNDIVPQLRVYDDAWSALALFTDLIQRLGERDGENIKPGEFVQILIDCGFTDDTEYKDPYPTKNFTSHDPFEDHLNMA